MIYFASDMHAENRNALAEYEKIAKKGDLLIILGDLGIRFENTDENREFTEYFFSLKGDIALVEGNHENHPYINSHPVESWHGGLVHRLSDNVVHLIRGNVFEIEGETFLAMGGCKSSPIWKERGLYFEGEDPSEAEIKLAYENLERTRVDYVLTHKYEWVDCSGAPRYSLEGLIHYLKCNADYKGWISGHWHGELHPCDKCITVYDRLVPLFEVEEKCNALPKDFI